MRILIAGKYSPYGSNPIGGLQSWTKTIAEHLPGHDVTVWEKGQPLPDGRFDMGIVANHGDTGRVWELCDRTINVSHGIIPAEKPGPADVHVFTSEGVRDHWGVEGHVIRQPIDTDFWSPARDPERTTLVRYSYRGGLAFLPAVANQLGLRFHHLDGVTHEQARDVLRHAFCVLATGRAALEAMACGAPVVILDHRSAYQGPLLDLDTAGSMARNYSGRGGITPAPQTVAAAIRQAKPMRDHVLRHHDAGAIAEQLCQL